MLATGGESDLTNSQKIVTVLSLLFLVAVEHTFFLVIALQNTLFATVLTLPGRVIAGLEPPQLVQPRDVLRLDAKALALRDTISVALPIAQGGAQIMGALAVLDVRGSAVLGLPLLQEKFVTPAQHRIVIYASLMFVKPVADTAATLALEQPAIPATHNM
jgi:hypothetical protein